MEQDMHVIDVTPAGVVTAMHNDAIDLSVVGPQRIERASEIKWDEKAQKWDVLLNVDGEFVLTCPVWSGFDSYEEARTFEVNTLNAARLYNIDPATMRAADVSGLVGPAGLEPAT